MGDIAFLASIIAVVSLARVRLRALPLTAPMLFVAIGLVLGPDLLGVLDFGLDDETVALVAELTLALVLFADAARIDVKGSCANFDLPVRLLGIGLPLAIGLGTVMTAAVLTDLSWAEAALVAAVLAPTDAALGEAVVSNPAVPVRIRQALNVESGLNDGLVVPVIAVFSALAVGDELEGAGSIVGEALGEITIAVAVGGAAAFALARIVPLIENRGWTDEEGFRLVALGVGVGAFAGSVAAGGNGFLAAFVCGLAARFLLGPMVTEHTELAEDLGQVGAAATFTIFGAVMVWPALEVTSPLIVLCAIGTLTVGRMIPVAISMIGTGLRRPTVGFLGWFGPRGLASMLFGLLILAEGEVRNSDQLFSVITLVIVASVVLHGITATPLAERYAAWYEHSSPDSMMESEPVAESPLRWRRSTTTQTTPAEDR
ncbi:MAG: cation:proton antiporter [Acidimicrobiales bacterium]